MEATVEVAGAGQDLGKVDRNRVRGQDQENRVRDLSRDQDRNLVRDPNRGQSLVRDPNHAADRSQGLDPNLGQDQNLVQNLSLVPGHVRGLSLDLEDLGRGRNQDLHVQGQDPTDQVHKSRGLVQRDQDQVVQRDLRQVETDRDLAVQDREGKNNISEETSASVNHFICNCDFIIINTRNLKYNFLFGH